MKYIGDNIGKRFSDSSLFHYDAFYALFNLLHIVIDIIYDYLVQGDSIQQADHVYYWYEKRELWAFGFELHTLHFNFSSLLIVRTKKSF